MNRGLISEVVAATLGRALDLPIPDFVIADVSKGLIDHYEDDSAAMHLGRGPAFASLWQETSDVVTAPGLDKHAPDLLAKIYAFDHWILNGDRSMSETGGNANLIERLSDNTLIVIDHNLAFSGSYSPTELVTHACRGAWIVASADYFFETDLRYRMLKAGRLLSEIIDALPEDWTDGEDDFLKHIETALARVATDQFWNEL